jgi:hypothetical protein
MEIPQNKELMVMGYERIKMRDFLIELEKNFGIVSITCLRLHVGRRTFYDWCNRDSWFREASDEIRKYGKDELDDIAYAGMADLIMKQNVPMTIFYLKTRHPKFRQGAEQEMEKNEEVKVNSNEKSIVETIRAINQVLEEEGWKEPWEIAQGVD